MKLTESEFISIIDEVKLAPSAHNTQPGIWEYVEGQVSLSIDNKRKLPFADPLDNDLLIGLGGAIEGLDMSLRSRKYKLANIEQDPKGPIVFKAQIVFDGEGSAKSLNSYIYKRYCHRYSFQPVNQHKLVEVFAEFNNDEFTFLTSNKALIKEAAKDHDKSTYHYISQSNYYMELFSWLRLKEKSKDYYLDGLNLASMGLNKLEQIGAKIIMQPFIFNFLKMIGLGGIMTAEASKVSSASGLLFVIVPKGMAHLERGRIFYRKWLQLTKVHMAAGPLSTLVDHSEFKSKWSQKIDLDKDYEIVNILKFGPEEMNKKPKRCRLNTSQIIGKVQI